MSTTHADPFFQTDFEAAEFVARRARVMDAMGNSGVALIAGATATAGFDPFRQTNDFYYLCGVETHHAYLLIDAGQRTATLYLPPTDARHAAVDGPVPGVEHAAFLIARAGLTDVRPLSALPADLAGATHIWTPRAPAAGARMCQDTLRAMNKAAAVDPMGMPPSREAHLLSVIARINPSAALLDLSPALHQQRLIKSPAEINLMRRAGRLTADATLAAMQCTRAGLYEYHLAAAADYVFIAGGARGGAYRPIIAAGDNIPMMHYWRMNCPLRDGEMVLFDYAPDLNNYTSDIGRMWPINGVYSREQRRLYSFAVAYHRVLLERIRPGVLPEQVLEEGAAVMQPKLDGWGFDHPDHLEAARRMLKSPRPMSHGVGMPVHETAGYFGRPLEVGMVLALDPELWLPEARLYVRCEDTVVVTADGCENLTAGAPLDCDEIEATLRAARNRPPTPPPLM
jgi:Xaa-Pro aminopeptidase